MNIFSSLSGSLIRFRFQKIPALTFICLIFNLCHGQISYVCSNKSVIASEYPGLIRPLNTFPRIGTPVTLQFELVDPNIKNLRIEDIELSIPQKLLPTFDGLALTTKDFSLTVDGSIYSLTYTPQVKFNHKIEASILLWFDTISHKKFGTDSTNILLRYQTCKMLKVKIPLAANYPPELHLSSYSIEFQRPALAGEVQTIDLNKLFNGQIVDPDQDILKFSIKNGIENFSLDPETNIARFTSPVGPLPNNGRYSDSLQINDSNNNVIFVPLNVQIYSNPTAIWTPSGDQLFVVEGALHKANIKAFNSLTDIEIGTPNGHLLTNLAGGPLSDPGLFTWNVPCNALADEYDLNVMDVGKVKYEIMFGGMLREKIYSIKVKNSTDPTIKQAIDQLRSDGTKALDSTSKVIKKEIIKTLLVASWEAEDLSKLDIAKQLNNTIRNVAVVSGAGLPVVVGLQGINNIILALSAEKEKRIKDAKTALLMAEKYWDDYKKAQSAYLNQLYATEKLEFIKTADKIALSQTVDSLKKLGDLRRDIYRPPYRGRNLQRFNGQLANLLNDSSGTAH